VTFGGNGQDWPPRRRGNPQDEALDNLREVAERINDFLRRVSPWTILPILLALYLLTGIYIVAPDERAVVLRFGKAVREERLEHGLAEILLTDDGDLHAAFFGGIESAPAPFSDLILPSS